MGHKPTIETMINTVALSLTSFGAIQMTTNGQELYNLLQGGILILFGAGLEFFKYWGRQKNLW